MKNQKKVRKPTSDYLFIYLTYKASHILRIEV